MGQASGVYKQLAYKVANAAGLAAGGAGAKLLRRVTSTIDLTKDTYQSEEIRSDFQMADFRHGVRRVPGSLRGQLSPATYADFFAGALKRDFTAVTAVTAMSITIAGAGPIYTVTRAAGSWLTNNIKTGHVGRLSAGSFAAANANKNLVVIGVTALVLTVLVLNGTAMLAEGPIAGATFTVIGKTTFTPQTGHIEKFFTIEEFYPEVPASEVGYDLRVSQLAANLPATGMATIDITLMGKDVNDSAAQYFTAPTAATTTGLTAAVNGVATLGGVPVATLTSLQITVASAYTGEPVVGANVIPSLTPGRVIVTGQATIKFIDTTARAAFKNETLLDLICVLSSDNSDTSEFISFALGRIKLSGATKDDGEKEIVQTVPFQALLNAAGGAGAAGELTTLQIQDSAAA